MPPITNYVIGNLTSTPVTRTDFLNETYTDDVYRFNISETNSINLDLRNISAGDDADLYLYLDSNNNGQWDTSDQQLASSLRGSNSDDSINYVASTGTYFARVQRFAPGSNGGLNYTLDLSSTQQYPSATTAPNLIPNEVDGGVLSRGQTYTSSGSVGSTDTSDIYRFSLASASNVNVRLTGLTSDADIRLIRDFNNNRIVDAGEVSTQFASTRSGTSSENFSFFHQSGIPFYVQVFQYSGDTNYQLQVNPTA
ncbi:PPC domain-containing protein [Microseira wollei]|uniref:Peptidase domain-containing protein n=1 Tax=Microseira wollei NIES-4236 TaxID=2530354 RepID=A0AAV3XBC2_9CYAN|nr:PPC domain-containing protein [Microseira wollei]GET36672.1 peptidase domain-containing protein [Microseira wollei NIES-4236]